MSQELEIKAIEDNPSIAETIAMARDMEKSIAKLSDMYPDHRSSLSDAMDSIAAVIDDLEVIANIEGPESKKMVAPNAEVRGCPIEKG